MVSKVLSRLKVKHPEELVQKCHDAFQRLPFESSQGKITDEIHRWISGIKECMFGDGESPATCSKENALAIAREAARLGLLSEIVEALPAMQFETRKDAEAVFGALLRVADASGAAPGAAYVEANQDVLQALFDGYDDPEIALTCGRMLRECVRFEPLARAALESSAFGELFDRLEAEVFETASDAFLTFRDLLTRHKPLVARFLADNYDAFFARYNLLLQSPNYVARRQSVRLLGELLLDRPNVKVMVAYVADVANLCLQMNLLKDAYASIQFEAFHVFKVFVANPHKTPAVARVLANNREKLLRYLAGFHEERDDERFKEEKAVIMRAIEEVEAPPGDGDGEGGAAGAGGAGGAAAGGGGA